MNNINRQATVAQKNADEVVFDSPPQFFDAHLLENTNLDLSEHKTL